MMTMSSNHPYMSWHPSQSIHGHMCETDEPFHRQQSKGSISILVSQYLKVGPAWMEENWHTSCSFLGWCVMYHELESPIQVLTPLSIHLYVNVWGWCTAVHATKHAKVGSLILIGYLSWTIAITCIKCWINTQPTHWPCITTVPCCIWWWLHSSAIFAHRTNSKSLGRFSMQVFRTKSSGQPEGCSQFIISG